MDGNVTLLHRVAALHVVYQINKSQILWFGQLVAHSPGIMVHLRNENKYCDSNEMASSGIESLYYCIMRADIFLLGIYSGYIQNLVKNATNQGNFHCNYSLRNL